MIPPQDGSWLALLVAGADAAQMEAALQSRLAASADDAERARHREDARLAGRLSAELQENRQQRAELAALYDIGVRLSAVREVDALLEEVVAQARRLLGVDVAYLALLEPDSSLTIRVTEGSLGPRLRGVRLPPRSGLAGQVVTRGEPVSSLDYLQDVGLRHTEGADQIAGDERLRTITGVPLRVDSEVIGVLMTANRQVRPLLPRELSMLTSFASMVAVALESARLFEELTRVADDLRRSSEVVTRASTLHERLMDAALRGGGVDRVIASLSDVVGASVSFADGEDRVVAAAERGRSVASPPVLALPGGGSPAGHFRSTLQPVRSESTVVVPVAAVDEYYGALSVTLTGPADETLLRLLERAALTLALLESTQRAIAAVAGRSASEILEQLFGARFDDDPDFPRRALGQGLDVSADHVVVVVEPEPGREGRAGGWLDELVRRHGGLTGTVEGLLVGLIRNRDGQPVQVEPPAFPFGRAGRAGPASGPLGLALAWQEARSCVRALASLDRTGVVASARDLGPYHFLLGDAGRSSARAFVQAMVGDLVRADRRGELCRTAEVYLNSSCRHQATAAELNVHPNTLYQRLDRIAGVLGPGWKDGDRGLDVRLALRVRRLLDLVDSGE